MARDAALPSVTIAILTFNGEKFLEDILIAIEGQEYGGVVETLVVDSGSTDGTLSTLARHPSVRIHRIPNEEFGHGRTRALAAELATGEIVAYLTHDAVPADGHWLAEIVAPFVDDPRTSAVIGKQVPRASAPPVLKYDIDRVFRSLGPDSGITVTWDVGRTMTRDQFRAATFYSDANSAARRSVLLGPVPYRDVPYAEDQLFGRDLFERGYRKAYAPAAAVVHSNETSLRTFGSRIAADVRGLRGIGASIAPVSRLGAFKQFVKWSAADAAFIVIDDAYSRGRKLYWLLVNPWYHLAKWTAYRRATRSRVESESPET